MPTTELSLLPPHVRERLDALVTTLAETLGDALAAVVVHGSAVRGGYVAGHSDVDLLIVLRDDARAVIERVGNEILLARTSVGIESMLLRDTEITRAADVFPLLFDDVHACHVVLHGDDPFADLHAADTHRRLRIEQELRDARIRLRLVLADATARPGRLAGAVSRKIKQLRSPLRALLRLHGREIDDDVASVMKAACAHYGADADALLRCDDAPIEAFDALTTLLDAAIDDVDTLAVGD